jgi:hypothetical protein
MLSTNRPTNENPVIMQARCANCVQIVYNVCADEKEIQATSQEGAIER